MVAGATGYVVKDSSLADLLEAVRDVAMGRVRIPLAVIRRAFAVAQSQSEPARERNSHLLTEREWEVLTIFARGSSYADIAETHGNSPSTVRNSIYRIQDKLGVGSRQGLVVWAVRNGHPGRRIVALEPVYNLFRISVARREPPFAGWY